MSKPQQVLVLDPPSELIFVGLSNSESIERWEFTNTAELNYFPFTLEHVKALRLSNPTTQAVFFEVETIAPYSVLDCDVGPKFGLIEPGHTLVIQIGLLHEERAISDSCEDVTHEFKIQTAYKTDEMGFLPWNASAWDHWNTVDKSQIMESILTVKILRRKLSAEMLQHFLSIATSTNEDAQKAILQSQQVVEALREKQRNHSKNGVTETAKSLANEIEAHQRLALVFKQKVIEFKKCNEHFGKGDLPLFEKEPEQAIEKIREGILQLQQRQKSLVEMLEILGIIDKHNEEIQKTILQSQQLVEVLQEKQEKHSKNGDTETAKSLANEIELQQRLPPILKKFALELFENGDQSLSEKQATQIIEEFQQQFLQLQQRQKSLVEMLEILGTIEKIMDKQMLLRNVDRALGKEIFNTIIIPNNPFTMGQRQGMGVKLADIEGNDNAKTAMQHSVIFPMINPRLFSGLRAASKGILLYGPPGNGKTMIAKAAAEEAKCTFFNISASTIMAKCYTWEGEKMVRTLFQMARNAQPSIIFIDEIDSMLCERTGSESGSERRVKTEFLVQMDGCANQSDDKFLVLGATNRPHELDDGVLRRLPQRIFIDLPNSVARRSFIVSTFKKHKTTYEMTNSELDEIANKTEGYSYSDLLVVCRAAAIEPLNEIDMSTLPETTPDMLRPMNYQDLITAIQSTRPSTNMENRRKLQEFASGSDRKG